jgi:DNA-binding PadR family transcriptional regulator
MEGGGHPQGRRRRQFTSDGLRIMVLSLIGDGIAHGYELIRAFEERSGGAYVPSPGVIYPLLTLLNETGLVDSKSEDGGRKSYRLTDAGKAENESQAEVAKILFGQLTALADKAERVDPTPVRRAMQGLKMALVDRLGRNDTTPETTFAAVALIDAATREIERL